MKRKVKYYTVEADYKSGDTTEVITERTKTKAYALQDELLELSDIKSVTVNYHYEETF